MPKWTVAFVIVLVGVSYAISQAFRVPIYATGVVVLALLLGAGIVMRAFSRRR